MHASEQMNTSLPEPDVEARAHSERLQAVIRDEIEYAGGSIPFERFMHLALYAPGLGYYSGGLHKFGREGDFTTAPEMSALFSQCLAVQCAQVLDDLGHADILEVGAGSGIMAAGMLAELERLGQLPDNYFILELSAELRERQRDTIKLHVPQLLDRLRWLDALPLAGFRGVVVSNELLDAMPVHRFRIENGEPRAVHVKASETGFETITEAADDNLRQAVTSLSQQLDEPLAEGYESEINFAACGWIKSVAGFVDAGMVLLVDYGFPQHEFYHPQRSGGTLMCHYRHRAHPDPLVLIGLQDITAHIDFTSITEAAAASGFDVTGFTTQAHFLLSLGIEQRIAGAADPITLAQQVKQLVLPSGMGELFKVIALTRGMDIELQGFAMQDQRGRL